MVKKIITIIFFLCISITIYTKFIQNNKITGPKIILNGKHIITITPNEKYQELGFKATDQIDGDLTKKVKIKGQVESKIGTYELTYTVTNSKKETAEEKRFIKVQEEKQLTYKDKYDKIDNQTRGWWSDNKLDHQRPAGGANINELKKYNAYFLGPDKKVIYLTFDEGGGKTYVKEIVDVLNQNNVKATFFLCLKYMTIHSKLIKQMVNSGHSIGNHTRNHLRMPHLATRENFNKYLYEIKSFETAYYNITGKNLDKIYRDPRGEWSYRDLQIVKDLGYKTYFYSADYYDFDFNVTKEKALNELTKRAHNGAIYLIHPKNKGNYLAMDSFIKEMKKQGYTFDLVKNIH
jgi:delta-lactam-biosynthetic de-N-acetylase